MTARPPSEMPERVRITRDGDALEINSPLRLMATSNVRRDGFAVADYLRADLATARRHAEGMPDRETRERWAQNLLPCVVRMTGDLRSCDDCNAHAAFLRSDALDAALAGGREAALIEAGNALAEMIDPCSGVGDDECVDDFCADEREAIAAWQKALAAHRAASGEK